MGELGEHAVLRRPHDHDPRPTRRRVGGVPDRQRHRHGRCCAARTRGRRSRASARARTTSRTSTRRWRRGSSTRRRAATSSPRPSTRRRARARGRRRRQAGSVAQRLAIHGIKVEPRAGGVFVPLRQPLRGLIAPILDSEAVLPMIETAQRRVLLPRGRTGRRHGAGDAVADAGRAGELRRRSRRASRATYDARTTANVISTAGDATLTVADPSAHEPGPPGQRQRSRCRSRSRPGQHRHVRRGRRLAARRAARRTAAPVSNDAVTIGFKQAIGANDALRTGHLRKTLTFTLSTTNP